MRLVPSALLVLSILGATVSVVGCADESQPSYELAKSKTSTDEPTKASATSAPSVVASDFTVHGTINDSDMAAKAVKAKVYALANDGSTTEVTTTNVTNGSFSTPLSGSQSPTGIFIVKLLAIGEDVIGSGTINGALPLAKGIILDAPFDALTSFKTNVIQQIATGKVPGLQNYVNVVEAFVNSELLNAVQLDDGVSTDAKTIINATADAITAGENVIIDTLQKAGVNVDFSALQSAQGAIVTGIDTGIDDAQKVVLTGGVQLVSGIEGAIKSFTGPVDQILFNAIANGGAAFSNSMKQSSSVSTNTAFAASKSSFKLQTALSTSQIKNSFAQTNSSTAVADGLNQASDQFMSSVNNAHCLQDLDDAKAAFMNVLLGNNSSAGSAGSSAAPECCILQLICGIVDDMKQIWYQFDATFKPWVDKLAAAFGTCDYGNIGQTLTDFDNSTANFETTLPGLDSSSAKSFSHAVRLVQKQIPQ